MCTNCTDSFLSYKAWPPMRQWNCHLSPISSHCPFLSHYLPVKSSLPFSQVISQWKRALLVSELVPKLVPWCHVASHSLQNEKKWCMILLNAALGFTASLPGKVLVNIPLHGLYASVYTYSHECLCSCIVTSCLLVSIDTEQHNNWSPW